MPLPELDEQVGGVEDEDEGLAVDVLVKLHQQVAVLADEIRLDLQSEDDAALLATRRDLAEHVARLPDVVLRPLAFRRVEREAADELGAERLRERDGAAHVMVHVLAERHVAVAGAVIHVLDLHLADGRAEGGDADAEIAMELLERFDFVIGELHHVLEAVAGVHETDAVILETGGGEHGHLLERSFLDRTFVGET